MVYNVIEVANTHNGSFDYFKELINSFSEYGSDFGIKLQIFKYDQIAKNDFVNYENFKRFYFTPEQWNELIVDASKTKDVWIDVFDGYGVEILDQNLSNVAGIKFQASSLYNLKLIQKLSNLDLSNKILVLNIAALSIEEIQKVLDQFKAKLNVKEIILQIGFQSYPTAASDAGLVKIQTLKTKFKKRISFADHVDGSTEEALWLPILAAGQGADMIEKHVMLSTRKTEIDHFSSLTPERYSSYIANLRMYENCMQQPFINDREKLYLDSTVQIPFVGKPKRKGELLNIGDDLEFKRTGQSGLRITEINDLVSSHHIIGNDLNEGDTFKAHHFKKANIGAIIACRLKSSRLTQKATIKIGSKLTSIEHCLKNTMRFKNINHTVLATSTEAEDAPLENYCYSDSVIFHKGDPIDVIERYLSIIDRLGLDIVVRITGDNPYVSAEIFDILLDSHFKNGADYTAATNAAPGTGVEIMNVSAMKKIKYHFPRADQSEYMTWYFKNNEDHFNLNMVQLPSELSRDYRLSLDYPEDLELMQRIEEHFENSKQEYSTRELFRYLDENPNISAINKELDFTFKTDQKLIDFLNEATRIKV